jgi:hypothetical protein
MTPETAASLTAIVSRWVVRTENLRAAALLGSWARGEAMLDSDLDLLILETKPDAYLGEPPPLAAIGLERAGYRIASRQRQPYGVVTSQILTLEPSAEVELAFAGLHWAEIASTDPGTAAVIRGGFCILVDKDDLLRRAAVAIAN